MTFSSDGSKITSGTYNAPAQCSNQADSGTVIGVKVPQFSGSYAGMLTSSSLGTNAFIVTVSQSGLSLNVSGTMNGTPFTMSGSVVGATFDVTGTISGQSMEALGLYDLVNNDFGDLRQPGQLPGSTQRRYVWSKNSNRLKWHNLRFPRLSSNRFR